MSTQTAGPRTLWGVRVTHAIGLLLVPLVVVGVFLWGLWDPTSRLSDVRAAVVNLDEPVTVDGQMTPLGRVLAAELIGTTDQESFEWVLTDRADAEEGLATGAYVTVVTIPENFSASATSLAEGPETAQQAHISVETSERARLLDAALSAAVTQTAARVLNEQLGTAFVGNVFVGMQALGGGIVEAAEGADLLADGLGELGGGIDGLQGGLAELHSGLGELHGGLGELHSGTGQLSAGVNDLAAGAGQFAEGLGAYANGVDELAAGSHAAAAGSHTLAEGVAQYTGTVNRVLEPLHEQLEQVVPDLIELRERIEASELPIEPETRERVLEAFDMVIAAPEGLGQLIDGGNDLASGAQQSAHGLDELAAGVSSLGTGAHELAVGARDLAQGTSLLAAEVPALLDGVAQLSGGAGQLTDGAAQLAEGAGQLSEGADQAESGTRDLAVGLFTAAGEVPNYSDDEIDALAALVLEPVAADGESNSLFTGSGAPLFLSLALWAGALASFLLLTPLWRRTRTAALRESVITLRSAGLALAIGGVQGALAGTLVAVMIGTSLIEVVSYIGFAVALGLAFSLINQGLVALLGGFGRFISFTLLVLSFVAGIVSTVPGLLSGIADATPIGIAISGLQGIAEQGTPAASTVLGVIVWGIAGLMLTGFAVRRARRDTL